MELAILVTVLYQQRKEFFMALHGPKDCVTHSSPYLHSDVSFQAMARSMLYYNYTCCFMISLLDSSMFTSINSFQCTQCHYRMRLGFSSPITGARPELRAVRNQ